LTNNVWVCGIPGSKWSGIDIQMRSVLPCDRTDETPQRTFYHRAHNPNDPNNGHRGSYWGPGMGCGEDWIDFNHLTKEKIQHDINTVFSGTGYRTIKCHFLARKFNLDYIWNNFPDDKLVLIYREPQKSFAWWSEVMDFAPEHFPDYRPGYTDYNTMRDLLWKETNKITDFAIRKGLKFTPYTTNEFAQWNGFKHSNAFNIDFNKINNSKHEDVFIASCQIPLTISE
jgi:hypothetical protein